MVPTMSLLEYYQQNDFNPVLIALKDQIAWESYFAKRLNLYQRHLGIPLSLLRDRSVCEFGCNSGENALVLAAVGTNLTLVEPNAVIDLVIVIRVSEYTRGYILPLDSLLYPAVLDKYLTATVDPALTEFSANLKHLYETARSDGLERTPFYEQAYF